jgi:hypothetical protein
VTGSEVQGRRSAEGGSKVEDGGTESPERGGVRAGRCARPNKSHEPSPFPSSLGELPSGLSLRVEDSRVEPQGRRQPCRARVSDYRVRVAQNRRVQASEPSPRPSPIRSGRARVKERRQKGGRFCHLISARLAGGEKIPAGNEISIPAGDGDPFFNRTKGSPAPL